MNYDLKIFADTVAPEAINQIYTLMAQKPFVNERVRIMPDVHYGAGCVVGFTATLSDMIIPNVIGVDIGCGMLVVELGNIELNLKRLDNFIVNNVTGGNKLNKTVSCADLLKKLLCYKELQDINRIESAMGTLGGGNHFIEIDVDKANNKYLIIHSGSRNLGMQVANIFDGKAFLACKNAAKEKIEQMKEQYVKDGRQGEMPDALAAISKEYAEKTKTPKEYCYLDGYAKDAYMDDMRICQEFASLNRQTIADKIIRFIGVNNASQFETVHNFIDDKNIIRKGAIPAYKGQKVIIPMNMRDGCLVAVGKGNEDWNCSAPHGAGRLFKRSETHDMISMQEYTEQMKGIYSSTVNEHTLDEAPMAYKPMKEIIDLIGDTVEIIDIIKPIYNFKAEK